MTIAEIKEQIKSKREALGDLNKVGKHCPEYVKYRELAEKAKEKYYEDIEPQEKKLQDEIDDLEYQLRVIEDAKSVKLSKKLINWLNEYRSGVDFGYGGLKISWVSPDERFVIITNPGATAGQGTAMGAGGYYYSRTSHWLVDTKTTKSYLGSRKRFEVEGRLTKDAKAVMFAEIEKIRQSEK